jgi:hypothetical protein
LTFARSFSRKVEASYAPAGLRYMLQIESDQIRSAESAPSIVPGRAPAPVLAAKTGKTQSSRALIP